VLPTAGPPALDRIRLRAATRFELHLLSELPDDERARLGAVATDSRAFAIARDRAGLASAHVLDQDAARLLDSLARPGQVAAAGGGPVREAVVRLLLDGLLEAERGDAFEGGPVLHGWLLPEPPRVHARGRLPELALAALATTAAAGGSDPSAAARRLYRFNTLPATPRWRRRLPDHAAVTQFLRAPVAPTDAAGAWLLWRGAARREPGPDGATHKLYLSPTPASVPVALAAVLSLRDRAAPLEVKAGRRLEGLLRPDKLVAYFPTAEGRQEAAERLQADIGGLPAHGVPFTAPAGTGDGLLSWGVDAAPGAGLAGIERRESWRAWVTARLGAALVSGLAGAPGVDPVRFALDRLRLDGVDTSAWTPPPWFTTPASTAVGADH